MKGNAFKIVTIIIVLSFISLEAQDKSNYFQIGLYGLQSPVGTKDFQTGKLTDLQAEIEDLNGVFNTSIAYRSWDRNRYPSWDFIGYVKNYMSDMYRMTKKDCNTDIIQILTPPLYPVFCDPQDLSLSSDDKGNDRKLERDLFEKFVISILQQEFDLIKGVAKDTSELNEIILDKRKRPLGGFYLDDEPLVRHHDISVIEEIGKEVRRIEKKFFETNSVLSQMPKEKLNDYYHLRYIAFDCADLHGHIKANRKEDGEFYNKNGESVRFSKGIIYTVFEENTFDVLMPDFYKNDTRFWGEILGHIRYEYVTENQSIPIITPIISAEYREQDMKVFPENYYQILTKYLISQNVDGIWFYIWETLSPGYTDAKSLWEDPRIKLKETVQEIK